MGHGRHEPSGSVSSISELIPTQNYATGSPSSQRKNHKLIILSTISVFLLVSCGISAALLVHFKNKGSSGESQAIIARKPTQAISKTCSKTRYPTLCVNSLVDFPGSLTANQRDLVHISVNMTLQRVGKALYGASGINNLVMDTRVRSAYEDCLELLEDSVDQLSRSLSSVGSDAKLGSTGDVLTWLSAALTNQDTCTEGFEDVSGNVKSQMELQLSDLSELVSNALAIFSSSSDDEDFAGIPIQNRRRKLLDSSFPIADDSGFPAWVGSKERKLLETPISALQADIIVSKDGKNGTYKTITQAIKAAPQQSKQRTVIYIRAGRYEEKLIKVGKKKTNLMFIGDGIGKTIITGGKSVQDGLTTFHTASFAASGNGFIARDITFENYAGPSKHQAVALRVGADHAVVYHCSMIGYQDTLYVHSQRQFYRECDIYGTVDFIFGNAAVVLQKCNIYARKPMDQQKNTITAQNRKDPNQNTGISIHSCRILATKDLQSSKGSIQSFLGRPWKMYSRVVYLLSYMDDHIQPRGWLEWNSNFALDTLYYGEYMNFGPGGGVGQRVKWPGYRVITSSKEASKFTVAEFIYGSSWLPSTGVAFVSGLSV
ncbi:Pectinesterase [Thalictrum thalictroides]|uniref:Pectinesterase n=1 Tax=Thalictrum thalictroides TaxID=46969 RepID=A0A7J6V642_THATH|nr:Pectinesterase [Thalictrum thalictroides]